MPTGSETRYYQSADGHARESGYKALPNERRPMILSVVLAGTFFPVKSVPALRVIPLRRQRRHRWPSTPRKPEHDTAAQTNRDRLSRAMEM